MSDQRAYSGQKARILLQGQFGVVVISGHLYRRRARRRPPGSPGNNTTHRRKVEYCIATGRSSSTSRRYTVTPACRTANKARALSSLPVERLERVGSIVGQVWTGDKQVCRRYVEAATLL